jgi:thioesterase domain-containing protein/acyl carrier protein
VIELPKFDTVWPAQNLQKSIGSFRIHAEKSEPIDARVAAPTRADVPAREGLGPGPRDLAELAVVRAFEDVLGVSPVSVDDSFFDLGGDSVLALRLTARLGHELGSEVAAHDLYRLQTPEGLAGAFRDRRLLEQDSVVVRLQEGRRDRPPFAIIHGAGGEVCFAYHLARALGADQHVLALQSVGLYGGRPLETIEDMADTYARALLKVSPGPFFLAGHSMGALVAWDIACRLRSDGAEVSLVVLIDQPSPTLARARGAPRRDAERILYEMMRGVDPPPWEEFVALEPEEKLEAVTERWKRHRVIPRDVGVDFVARFARIIVANVAAAERYLPPEYSGAVLVIRAGGSLDGAEPVDGGWPLGGRAADVRVVGGTHQTLLQPPNVFAVADAVRTKIDAHAEAAGTEG